MCKQQTDKAKYREEYSHLSGLQGLLELAESGHSIAQIVGIPTNRIDNKPIKYLLNSTYLNLPILRYYVCFRIGNITNANYCQKSEQQVTKPVE